MFNTIAELRGPHWQKSANECLGVADPIKAYIDTMSPAAVKAAAAWLLPFALVANGIKLLAYPLAMEVAEYERARSGAAGGSAPAPVAEPAAGAPGAFGATGPASSDGDRNGYGPAWFGRDPVIL